MEPVIFVEVLDRRGRVRRRERISRFPLTIGRAYSNDVIVDDRLADPEHLIVRQTEDGLRLEDRDSRNGVFADGPRRRVRSLKLEAGTEVRIGHTRLRFCTPRQPVAPAAGHDDGGVAKLFAGTWAKVAAIATALVTLFAADFFELYGQVEASHLLSSLAVALCLLLVWAGLWALGNRLVSHEFRFMAHWTVISVAAVLFTLLSTGFEYLDFFLSTGSAFEVAEWIAAALVSVGLIYAHLSVASTMAPARRATAAALTVAVVFGFVGVMEFAGGDDFSPNPQLASELKPVGARWLATRSPAEFFATVGSLKDELERLAEEEEKEEPPESAP
ncbi:MAG: FHA domain-containing protein [bacterium]|nr:FHA domain-containing protein [bacterium]